MRLRLFDEALAEGTGVGKVYGELRVAVGAISHLCHIFLPRSKAAFMNFVFFTAPGS